MSNIGIQTTEVAGFKSSIRGMRNPMDSWSKSDSKLWDPIILGEEDLILAKKLIAGGPEHCKFLRQIQVWANVSMPRYWWQEADTYKFGTKNSCSTMHTMHKVGFSRKDFYLGESILPSTLNTIEYIIDQLNYLRKKYLETKEYKYIIEMKRILPESFVQMRTWNTNYAEIMNMYHQRKSHRLTEEWVDTFCGWCKTLPYFEELCIKK